MAKKKRRIMETDMDFANYGKLRKSGKSSDESLDIISTGKKLKFKK